MTYTLNTLPEPERVQKFINIQINYDGHLDLECIGVSLVRIVNPPAFPDIECLHARAIQTWKDGLAETNLYTVPLEYVTVLNMIALPKFRFVTGKMHFIIALDKPAAKNRLPVPKIKDRLAEFGISANGLGQQ